MKSLKNLKYSMTVWKENQSWKVGPWGIVSDHYDTITNPRLGKADASDWITFLLIPFAVSISLFFCKIGISDFAFGPIISSLSIFSGLMLNSLVILFNISKGVHSYRQSEKKRRFDSMEEVFANTSYTILVAILCILLIFSTRILDNITSNEMVLRIYDGLIFFVLCHFFVTLLVVVKRINILFKGDLKEMRINVKKHDSSEEDDEESEFEAFN